MRAKYLSPQIILYPSCFWLPCYFVCASFHSCEFPVNFVCPAPRHRNSPYGYTTIRYVYDTRWTEQPHSPIFRSMYDDLKVPHVAPLHGIMPVHDLICANSIHKSTILASPPTSRFTWALCCCSNSLPIDASVLRRNHRHQHQQFQNGHCFILG